MGVGDDEDGDDGVDDAEASEECSAPGCIRDDSTESSAVAPEEETPMHLAYDTPDAMREWPRRVRARRMPDGADADTDDEIELYLWYPVGPEGPQQIPFTSEMYNRWLESRSETRDSGDVATWGPKTTMDFVVSTIDDHDRLVFDPSSTTARISLDIYNLDPSQPKWRRLLERSFAIIPIRHLETARLKSVFLDFYVGTNRIGRTRDGRGAPVVDGGTNWLLHLDGTAPDGISPDGCSCVCATYAALNRAWGQRDRTERQLPATEAALDDAFDHEIRPHRRATTPTNPYIQFTFYHELGHLLDNRGITHGIPRSVWNQYRLAMNYHGESNGDGEGFAEAYRQRLLGNGHSSSTESSLDEATRASAVSAVDDAFETLHMPTRRSVQAAWRAIRAHFGDS